MTFVKILQRCANEIKINSGAFPSTSYAFDGILRSILKRAAFMRNAFFNTYYKSPLHADVVSHFLKKKHHD